MTTAADVVNRALELIGSQVQVTGTSPAFDGTVAGNAAGVLYSPAVEMLLRQLNPDFARKAAALAAQGSGTLVALTNWTQEYTYPSDALRLRQLRPQKAAYDVNDPLPIPADVMFDPLSAGGPAKVIMTSLASAIAVYTTRNAGVGQENLWDSAFTETVARRLANPLAMAVAGRPDFARELLEESERFAQMADLQEEL